MSTIPEMSPRMQRAAVEAAIQEGRTLDQIASDHPELTDTVKLIRDEQEKKEAPKRRGSGPAVATYLKPPRI